MMLLCPRDYLSSYMKLGTIALLVIGTIVVAPPHRSAGAVEIHRRRRTIIPGKLYPFVFITIACGAISASRAHRLRHDAEDDRQRKPGADDRLGAMLCEGLVGCVRSSPFCALHPATYYGDQPHRRQFRSSVSRR